MIQDPGDSGESSETFARIEIEQSQNPRYSARCVASRPFSQDEAIVRLFGALTSKVTGPFRSISTDSWKNLGYLRF